MTVYHSACLSFGLFVFLPISLSAYLFACLTFSVCLYACLTVYLSVFSSPNLYVCLSGCQSSFQATCLTVNFCPLLVCLHIYLPICQSILTVFLSLSFCLYVALYFSIFFLTDARLPIRLSISCFNISLSVYLCVPVCLSFSVINFLVTPSSFSVSLFYLTSLLLCLYFYICLVFLSLSV